MSTTQPRMVIQRYEGFGGNFIDSQYLGASYKAGEPQVLDNMLMRMYSAKNRFFTGKSLIGMTGAKLTGVKEVETEVLRWYLQGADYKSARIMQVLDNGNTPGINKSTFRIKLDLDFFSYPDVLMPEDPEYPLEIVSKVSEGTGTVYTVRLQGDNPARFLPTQYLQVGSEFCKVWTSVPSEYKIVMLPVLVIA